MAKGGKLTQKDIMIWTMNHPNGTKFYYLIEKEPYEKEGLKKALHRVGSMGDAVFRYLDQAQAELAKYPPGEEETPAETAPEATTDAAAEAAAEEAGA